MNLFHGRGVLYGDLELDTLCSYICYGGKLYPRNKCNGHHHFDATIIGHRLQTSYSRVDTFKRTVFPSGIRLSGTNHQLLVHVPGAQSFDLFYS